MRAINYNPPKTRSYSQGKRNDVQNDHPMAANRYT